MRLNPANVPKPPAIAALPTYRGMPIPFFVQPPAAGAAPDFRIMSPDAMRACLEHGVCWVSGKPLLTASQYDMAFVGGPISAILGNYVEPASRPDCAIYAAQVCPYMVNPEARHRESAMPEHKPLPGTHVEKRIPVTAIVVVRAPQVEVHMQGGGPMFLLTGYRRVHWYTQGREATAEEAAQAVQLALEELATHRHKPGMAERIERGLTRIRAHLPKEAAA